MIDGCQALNLPRDYKYEQNFGYGEDVAHIRDEFDPDSIFSYQLADFAETCSIDKKLLSRTLKTLSGQVLKALDEMLIDTLFDDSAVLISADKDYWQELKENIELRTTHLLEQAEEIPNIIV